MTRVAAVVLAAGRSSRFRAEGGTEETKLVASVDGKPIVRRVVETALASQAGPVVVVVGHASSGHHREIELAAAQQGQQAGKVIVDDAQAHLGVAAHNPADCGVNVAHAHVGPHPDLQLSLGQAAQQFHFASEIGGVRHHLARVLQEDRAGIGNFHPARTALEDLHTCLLLQALDAARQRWL